MHDRTNQVIVGVVVVILIAGAWYVGRAQGKIPSGTTTSTATVSDSDEEEAGDTSTNVKTSASSNVSLALIMTRGESVAVVDQSAGPVVKVASVTLPQLGWVAVRDSKGWVLGAGRFVAGTSKNVEVILLRNTVAGEKYQVLLYSDDGDMKYDLHKDSLVMNADASVAGTTFTAR